NDWSAEAGAAGDVNRVRVVNTYTEAIVAAASLRNYSEACCNDVRKYPSIGCGSARTEKRSLCSRRWSCGCIKDAGHIAREAFVRRRTGGADSQGAKGSSWARDCQRRRSGVSCCNDGDNIFSQKLIN